MSITYIDLKPFNLPIIENICCYLPIKPFSDTLFHLVPYMSQWVQANAVSKLSMDQLQRYDFFTYVVDRSVGAGKWFLTYV